MRKGVIHRCTRYMPLNVHGEGRALLARVPLDRGVGRLGLGSNDLIVTVGCGLSSNAGETRESDFRRADDPDRLAALAPHPPGVCVHRGTKPFDQIGAICARVRSQVEFGVFFQRDRCEPGLHCGSIVDSVSALTVKPPNARVERREQASEASLVSIRFRTHCSTSCHSSSPRFSNL